MLAQMSLLSNYWANSGKHFLLYFKKGIHWVDVFAVFLYMKNKIDMM